MDADAQSQFALAFQNLNYEVEKIGYSCKNGTKTILKSISGAFRSGELSAIVGPSGSGKSSLLNILSGFKSRGVSGVIKVDNKMANSSEIRNISSYIMQETEIQDQLTTYEAIAFAARFKSIQQWPLIVENILTSMNLYEIKNSYVKNLSGGQKKRLAIAFELIDNPSIIFLDEPTTGLDSSSSLQCMRFLRDLAKNGNRTIICTIHQPSPLIFDILDQIYAIADGCCIYQGSSSNLVKFLIDVNLPCPSNYSPSDYLLEISTNDYGNHNANLTHYIENGVNESFRGNQSCNNNSDQQVQHLHFKKFKKINLFREIGILSERNIMISMRDKTLTIMCIGSMLGLGLSLGILGYNMGNNAARVIINGRILICLQTMLSIISYNTFMTIIPLQYSLLKREHFNQWYSEVSYILALIICDLPIMILGCSLSVCLVYYLSSQPMELFRFIQFLSISLMNCWASQGVAMMGTVYFNIQYALTYGLMLMLPYILYSLTTSIMNDVPKIFQYLFEFNFVHQAIEASIKVVYGHNREHMQCDEEETYCHYSDPEFILKSFIGTNSSTTRSLVISLIFALISRFLAFIQLRIRLYKR